MADLLLGARLAFAGGRDGWTRTVLTALGVGIGVALLLLAAAVPGALAARQARGNAREGVSLADEAPAAAGTLLVGWADTEFRGTAVRGRMLRPEGPRAPVPPGLTALPRAGEAIVSPALREVLDSPGGELFAPRLGGARVTGTIGEAGLAGPGELAYYVGSDTLTAEYADRVESFGTAPTGEALGSTLTLLVVIIFVVLLLPIAVFLGAAVRFGGERRDRRLAALRLIGADRRMVARIAAGEAAVAALLGVVVGGLLFALGRRLVPLVTLWDLSVYADDVRPDLGLVLAIVAAVPAVAVAVSLIALRGTVIEPLGVVRRATAARRRLWWRLVLPALGVALLYPLAGGIRSGGPASRYQVAAGATLLLIGAITLLPWLIDVVVRRMRGGAVPWQLAIRRLQQDSATSARLVSGIAVAVAGTIGLQMLLAGVQQQFTTDTGQDTSRAQAVVQARTADGFAALARVRAAPGIVRSFGTLRTMAVPDRPAKADGSARLTNVHIGDCAALAEYARLDTCADGDVFVSGPEPAIRPGDRLVIGGQDNGPRWTLPTRARVVPGRPDPFGVNEGAILVTPGVLDLSALGPVNVSVFVSTDPADPDAIERVRNAAAAVSPSASVNVLSDTTEARRFVNIRRGLYAGAVVTVLLVGASLLVGVLEQLRERRRLLAMLVAVGTRRGTLAWSVVWQTAVPVLLALTLAVAFGLALGIVLLRLVTVPIAISWTAVGLSTGLAAAVMALVTLLSLPALWRLMHPDALRTE